MAVDQTTTNKPALKKNETLRKCFSYLWPVRLHSLQSEVSGNIFVTLVNGRVVLDTPTCNYSYGTLQRVLRKGLQASGVNENTGSILLLGLGGGSVVASLRKEFHCSGKIDALEIDPLMVNLANEVFGLGQYEPVQVHLADALSWVEKCKDSYALVIVDLFVNNQIPVVFLQNEFLRALCKLVQPGGTMLYNTLDETLSKFDQATLHHLVEKHLGEARLMPLVEGSNTLVIGKKIF